MTLLEIQQLSQSIADIYTGLETDLMMNIARQLAKDGEISATSQWRLQKLAEIGALDKKCIKTISQYSGLASDMLETVITQAALGTLSQLEPAFAELVRQGILGNAVAPSASTGIKQALNMYQKQAKDTLNLVNTVMRYKAKEAYINAVNKAAEIANKQEYLNTLNKATAGAATGSVSRQQALRQCIKEMSEKGIPAFVDKRGREWTPEAYINMDIKTTVSNVAHETQFARMDDYGIDLIEVSSHMGARPRCAPYQGRIYSRSGKNKNYPPWSSTSYGEAAGLLGINCHHKVYPYIEGISIQRYFPYKDEENSKRYKNTQVQRQLERDVRKSKRECAMLDAIGDKKSFSDAAIKLKQRQERLKAYCKEKGLSYKPDRTAVEGYNKSVSGKATQAEKKNYSDFVKSVGKENAPTIENYRKMVYSNSDEYRQLKGLAKYRQSVPNASINEYLLNQELKSHKLIKGYVIPYLPNRTYILEDISYKKDPAHIMKRMLERNITSDDVQSFVNNSILTVSQFNNERLVYYSEKGVAVLTRTKDYDNINWIVKTVWNKNDFDETIERILEVAKKYAKPRK